MGHNKNELDMIMDIDFITEKVNPILVDTMESFSEAKAEYLKCFYVGIHIKEDALSIVCDNGKYFVVDLNCINLESVADSLVFIKPKKVVFDISKYSDIINENSRGFIDIRLAFNLLYNMDFKKVNDLIYEFQIPKEAWLNIYLLYSNLILATKNINIYTEKNKLNKAYYCEMDSAMLIQNIKNRGIDINISVYEEIKNNLSIQIEEIFINAKKEYGDGFDFASKKDVLKAIKEGSRTLADSIVTSSDDPLYVNYNTFLRNRWINNLVVDDHKAYFDYNPYSDYKVESNLRLDFNFYGNGDIKVIKGEFGSLYYKVLAELSKDLNLIEAASNNNFIDYIYACLFDGEEKELHHITDIILKCFSRGLFEPFDIQKAALEHYDTILNVGDISNIRHLFEIKLEPFYEFIKNFDGESVIYERFNKKIFSPQMTLDSFIKQVINVIYKSSLLEMDRLAKDYTIKRKRRSQDRMEVCGVGENIILVSTTGEDAEKIAIDSLNRVMFSNYKIFVKNTKVQNVTGPLEQAENR